MMRTKIYILLLLVFLLPVSCHRDEEGSMGDLNILPFVDGVSAETLAVGSDFPSSREIVLSAVSEDFFGRRQVLFTDEVFRNTGERFWQGIGTFWPEHANLSLLGYSGEGRKNVLWDDEDPTAGFVMDVPDNVSLQEDILVGCLDNGPRMPWVEMEMRHVFSLLTFSVQSDIDFDPDLNLGISISGISISNVAFGGRLIVRRKGTGLKIDWSEISDRVKRDIDGINDVKINSFETTDLGEPLLVIPSEDQPITITYRSHNGFDGQGRPVNVDINHTVTPDDSLLPGSCTNYLIRITAKEVFFTPSVVPWTAVLRPVIIE